MEILADEREPPYLFSDEHSTAVFTDDICQRAALLMNLEFIGEIHGKNVRKSEKVKTTPPPPKKTTTHFYKKQYFSLLIN